MILFDLEIDKENWIFFQKSLEPNTHLPLIRMESVQFLYLPSWSRIDQCINPRPGALQQLTWYIHVPMAGMQGEKNQCWYNRLTLTWLRTARPQREKPSHRKMSSSFIVSVKGSEWKRQRRSWRSNRWQRPSSSSVQTSSFLLPWKRRYRREPGKLSHYRNKQKAATFKKIIFKLFCSTCKWVWIKQMLMAASETEPRGRWVCKSLKVSFKGEC